MHWRFVISLEETVWNIPLLLPGHYAIYCLKCCVGAEIEADYFDVTYALPIIMSNVSCLGIEEKVIDCVYEPGDYRFPLVSVACSPEGKHSVTLQICSQNNTSWCFLYVSCAYHVCLYEHNWMPRTLENTELLQLKIFFTGLATILLLVQHLVTMETPDWLVAVRSWREELKCVTLAPCGVLCVATSGLRQTPELCAAL